MGVGQRREQLRLALEAGEAIRVGGEGRGKDLSATSRPSLVSVARQTSPIPPAPSGETIAYDPEALARCEAHLGTSIRS